MLWGRRVFLQLTLSGLFKVNVIGAQLSKSLWEQSNKEPYTGWQKSAKDTNKGNNKITELRTILQRESQNS
jgi:hypothetical protein